MTKYLVIIVVIILLILGYATYEFSSSAPLIIPTQKSSNKAELEKYDFQNWHVFTASDGKFKVMFPTLPQHATETVKDPKTGENRQYDMYVSEKNDGTIFSISLITFSDKSLLTDKDKLMRSVMNDMISAKKTNELQDVKSGKYKDYPSLDYSFSNAKTRVDTDSFMVGDTLYLLTRIVKKENYNSDEFKFFVNSFDLMNGQQPLNNLGEEND